MHTIKLLLTYYLNITISVQAANLSDSRIESNRTFLPELECSSEQADTCSALIARFSDLTTRCWRQIKHDMIDTSIAQFHVRLALIIADEVVGCVKRCSARRRRRSRISVLVVHSVNKV